MNKKQKRNLCIIVLILLVLIIITNINLLNIIKNTYKEQIYDYANQVINVVVEKNPELEEEIIKEVFKKSTNNQDILNKYGFEPKNIDSINPKLNNLTTPIIIFTVLIMVEIIGIILIFIIYNIKQNKKIKELDKYCKELLKGNYLLDLKEQDESNFSILKNDIYDMTIMLKEKNSILEKNSKDIERLISDISHQLKTPLTALNLINDILYKDLDSKKKEEFLDNAQKELEKINWLVKNILNIAKLDSKTIKLKKKKENGYETLKEIKNNFKPMCEANNAEIKIISNKKEIMVCDKKWTMEAISNIVKNALEHEGKNIEIKVEENNIYTKLKIKDNGEGISKKDITHIFERFYKSENSSNDSLGIGLAFCKSIIDNQNGEIRVKSCQEKENSGTQFEIKLYK
ncbi:MAG: HAMP domain-containing histidine kinase [Clostridium sp.]|nr:HAMP domain-containing histidine kinase [Clostridium sp.]